MSESAGKAGRHGARDSAAARGLSHEAIKLLKTQDAGYLRTVGEQVRREMEKVRQDVQLQEGMRGRLGGQEKGDGGAAGEDDEDDGFDFGEDEDRAGRKVMFVDDRKEQRGAKKRRLRGEENETMEDDEEDDSFGQLQQQKQKMSRKQIDAERQALVEHRRARKMKKRAEHARQSKFTALKNQYADIVAAERELDWQRGKMDNSVGGKNKNGLKWKIKERKK